MSKLDQIREKLKTLNNKSAQFSGSTDVFPFWNIPDNSSATIRFLPDGDDSNTFFWVEKQVIKLEFPGVVGAVDSSPVTVTVPCVEMFGDTCPILTEVRPWWNEESLKDLASKYWKKRSYIFQGFVLDSMLTESDAPENPIRRFIIGPQIFNIIKSSLLDPDFENIPTDYENGTNFIISKTSKGLYADYSTSKWSRKETPLTQSQLDAIEEFGLTDLSTFLPAKPSPEQLNIIYEMFQASVDGEKYDPERWAKYYRPRGMEFQTDTTDASPAKDADDSVSSDGDDNPFLKKKPTNKAADLVESNTDTSEDTASTGKSPQEILEMIRNRSSA